MSTPPFMLFSARCEPLTALQFLEQKMPDATLVGEGAGWKEISAVWKRELLKSSLALRVTHDPAYYAAESIATQRLGMANYLSRFPGAARRGPLFEYVRYLNFALSFQFKQPVEQEDPRYMVLLELTWMVGGFIFLPEGVIDNQGRWILSANGQDDPRAEVPELPQSADLANLHGASSADDTAGDDDERPLNPPSALRAARRMQVLFAGAARGFIEQDPGGPAEWQGFLDGMDAALQRSGADAEAEPDEAQRLASPMGTWSDHDKWAIPWQTESAAMIAWALGLTELLSYDVQVSLNPLMVAVGLDFENDEAASQAVVAAATLRSTAELERMERCIFALHWRLRDFSVRPQTMDFRSFAQTAWFGPLDTGLAKFAGDDLAIDGKPIAECSEQEWRPVAGILYERHKAINWLLGHSEVYSETDTPT